MTIQEQIKCYKCQTTNSRFGWGEVSRDGNPNHVICFDCFCKCSKGGDLVADEVIIRGDDGVVILDTDEDNVRIER